MEPGTGIYQAILILHILCAVAALGPNFASTLRKAGDGVTERLAAMATFVQFPALFGVLVTGVAMLSGWEDSIDGKSPFAQTWVSIAFTVVIVMAVLTFLLARAYHQNAEKRIAPLSGVLHLLLVVALWLMVVQPGA